MFIATALSPRGEDNILSSSPQEVAHLIAKPSGHLPGRHAMESMGNTRHQDLSRRPGLISRIVSRSLFDVPVNNVGQFFRRADRKRMLNRRSGSMAAPQKTKTTDRKIQEGTVKCPISGSI
jgi:hypothetical protein